MSAVIAEPVESSSSADTAVDPGAANNGELANYGGGA